MRYGAAGISQVTFETAFEYLEKIKAELSDSLWNYEAFMSHLEKTYEEHTVLIYRIMSIYTCVSTKNPTNVGFLNYIINIIKHRSTLKNYINNGFRSAAHLADKENYYVQFNQDSKSYYVSQDMSLFAMEEGMGNTVSLSKSRLWQNMYL